MFAAILRRDNRPAAVSSAHWGDRESSIARRPAAVFSAQRGDMAVASAAITLFEAVLILLTTNILTLSHKDTHNPPGSPIHNSMNAEIRPQQSNARQKTRM